MPIRLCSTSGCPEVAAYRGKCDGCARVTNRQTHRNRENRRVYSSAKWRNTRKHVLHHTPLCSCGSIATDVHHRVDLSDGGDPYNLENLEALCAACHSKITRSRLSTK